MKMRMLAVLLVAIVLTLDRTTPGLASCAPPVPLADHAALAVAVIHGTVTGAGGGALTLRVDRVLKGQVPTSIRVYIGPGRGVGATSVDYTAAPGSDHVLYLIRGADGELETNSCLSHAGPAAPDELAYFGAGTAPITGSPEVSVTPGPAPLLAAALGVLLVGIGGAAVVARRRRL